MPTIETARVSSAPGRKRIVAPDSSETLPGAKPQPDSTLVKALARAWRCEKLLDDGICTGVVDLADAERINRSYVCRVLRLTLLAPHLVERILDGRLAIGLPVLMQPFPVEWRASGRSSADTALHMRPAQRHILGSRRIASEAPTAL